MIVSLTAEKLGIYPSSFQHLISALIATPGIQEVLVFGSRAKGNFQKGSDIDLAIKGNLTASEILDLKTLLNERLPIPYGVDIVVYDEKMDSSLKEHIDRVGICLLRTEN